ncbi:hypothetical protein BJ138DRAFT_1233098 [Hygrophoropsis aurantiaca]|uniref:Uncharacterized protein n=1 Tax=Hygrophoropsis aurantiaca TaxID=72124 RepID=A0ACB8ASG9_9AGAM|nr:hypothetical protein BJ138DRAFT_1233098 [Hygrophoropsis aurantiaca]
MSSTTYQASKVERNYQSFPGSQYILPSDDIERQRQVFRLALQHKVLKTAYDGRLIFPPVQIPAGANILDSGTGSGTWIMDVRDEVPEDATLLGIDIEARMFPPPDERMNFMIQSVTSLPPDWDNKFALVNQRLLIAGLTVSEWGTALREIYRILTPGGFVQLGEIRARFSGGPVTERQSAMLAALFEKKGLFIECAKHLPVLMKEAGFINVRTEEKVIEIGKWAGPAGEEARDNFIGVFRGLEKPSVMTGLATSAEYEELMENLEREWDEVTDSKTDFYVFHAQKPLIV